MYFIVFSIIIILLFCPIPLRIKLLLNGTSFSLSIFGRRLRYIKRKELDEKAARVVHKHPRAFDKGNVIYTLRNDKIKPVLKFNLSFKFGLDDAAYTAVLYGYLNTLYPAVIGVLNLFFVCKEIKYDIVPDFDKKRCELFINGIIFINLAKIIYILVSLFWNATYCKGYNFAKAEKV